MSEFMPEEILKRIRGGQTGAVVTVGRSSVATPSVPTTTPASMRASVLGAPRASMTPIPMSSNGSGLADKPQSPEAQAQGYDLSSSSGPPSPLYRKERLDVREALERDNAHLREELKKAKAEIKALKIFTETQSNEFRAYQAKKEGLLHEKLTIIGQLKQKLIVLTREKGPRYSNNKPLERAQSSPSTLTSNWLEKPGGSKKQAKANEEIRAKLEALSSAGNSAPFAKPTWNEVMRRITPHEQDFTRSFRNNAVSGLGSASRERDATGTAEGGSPGTSGFNTNNYERSPTHSHGIHDHYHQHSFHAANSYSNYGHHDTHGPFSLSSSGASKGHTHINRRPGAGDQNDEGDEPIVLIDLSTR